MPYVLDVCGGRLQIHNQASCALTGSLEHLLGLRFEWSIRAFLCLSLLMYCPSWTSFEGGRRYATRAEEGVQGPQETAEGAGRGVSTPRLLWPSLCTAGHQAPFRFKTVLSVVPLVSSVFHHIDCFRVGRDALSPGSILPKEHMMLIICRVCLIFCSYFALKGRSWLIWFHVQRVEVQGFFVKSNNLCTREKLKLTMTVRCGGLFTGKATYSIFGIGFLFLPSDSCRCIIQDVHATIY